ncbi:MAG: 3-dehydroquinate synthase [Alistipes sp.]|nr:3-dehydroquinate synthase [Alistipes sp.]MBR3911232.1 3-dehydroquinate synthase [Alistipes sp.]
MNFDINIKDRSRVVVGSVGEWLPRLLPQKRVIVVSDTNIDRHYHSLIEPYDHVLIGLGETSKTLRTLDVIYRRFIELGVDRSCFVLAVGGGIVTDVAGFAASTFMRGVEFGFISTSLLGQVDASVGGKNGVNVDGYKNMVGTFTQPRFVVCDVNLLRTLSAREFRTGLAEIIKAGVIGDATLFEMLEQADFSTLQRDSDTLREMVYRAIKVKADIVERDERESGDRRLLNLGHTLAHAIEKSSSKFNHGEAVAVGLAMIADVAAKQGLLAVEDKERILNLLQRAGFALEPPVEVRTLLKAVKRDKKAEGDSIHVVFPLGVGNCCVEKMPLEEFKALV